MGRGERPQGPLPARRPRVNGRTVRTTVTFSRPFTLQAIAGPLPPGAYSVETTEELIEACTSTPAGGPRS